MSDVTDPSGELLENPQSLDYPAPPRGRGEGTSAGVEVIVAGEGSAFDREVVETFRRVVFPYPVGTEIELPDGRVGVVARVDPADPDVPVVRIPGADGAEEIAVDTRSGRAP